MNKNKTTVIGLIGGIASGKSAVAELFVELGAGLLDADRAGHLALELPDVQESLRARFGETIFGANGGVDRARLAQLVFPTSSAQSSEFAYFTEAEQPSQPILNDTIIFLMRCR